MNPRTIETLWIAFCVVAVAAALAIGCGSVSPFPELGAGGADGGAAGAAQVDAHGPELGAGGSDGQADASAPLDAPKAPPCISDNAPGLSFGLTCDGRPAATVACHASCTVNGVPFAGCVSGSPYAAACYASCADCP